MTNSFPYFFSGNQLSFMSSNGENLSEEPNTFEGDRKFDIRSKSTPDLLNYVKEQLCTSAEEHPEIKQMIEETFPQNPLSDEIYDELRSIYINEPVMISMITDLYMIVLERLRIDLDFAKINVMSNQVGEKSPQQERDMFQQKVDAHQDDCNNQEEIDYPCDDQSIRQKEDDEYDSKTNSYEDEEPDVNQFMEGMIHNDAAHSSICEFNEENSTDLFIRNMCTEEKDKLVARSKDLENEQQYEESNNVDVSTINSQDSRKEIAEPKEGECGWKDDESSPGMMLMDEVKPQQSNIQNGGSMSNNEPYDSMIHQNSEQQIMNEDRRVTYAFQISPQGNTLIPAILPNPDNKVNGQETFEVRPTEANTQTDLCFTETTGCEVHWFAIIANTKTPTTVSLNPQSMYSQFTIKPLEQLINDQPTVNDDITTNQQEPTSRKIVIRGSQKSVAKQKIKRLKGRKSKKSSNRNDKSYHASLKNVQRGGTCI